MECNIRNVFLGLLFILYVSSVKSETTKVRFVPSNYKLEIFTKKEHFQTSSTPENLVYSGIVTIDFAASGTLPDDEFTITLNTGSKTIIQNHLLKGDGNNISSRLDQPKNGALVITVPKGNNNVEKFNLKISFTNPFGNDMTGFYRSSYKEKVGDKEETKWLLTTHFEPIYARNAFPCFDQPDLKAEFEIEITVPKDIKTVLSNAPQAKKTSSSTDTDMEIVVFEKTKYAMSTYLVAFTASNLVGTEEETILDNQKVKTYGREEKIKKGDAKVAQYTAKEALKMLSEYLAEKYSFGKIDQVGIPDFSAGAMENWGHISFREKALFVNELNPESVKQANNLTIIHELVHQWFGNLVTLESWDYIWLNEAFANYLEYVIGNMILDKNFELMKQVLVNEVHLRAFETDGLNSSTPLNYKIPNENLIVSSFNDIPYAKGAAVLRMWNYQLGDEKFKKALQEYIKNRKEKNANPNQLAEFLKESGLDEKFFKSWTDQAGYPVVELIKINSTHYNITQNRFFWEKETANTVYAIPMSFSTDKDPNFGLSKVRNWLDGKNMTVKKDWKWIVINNLQAGYYRVNYDVENWMALSDVLMSKNCSKIPDLNRAQIVNDIFSLARSLQKNYVDYSTAFRLSKYLKNETSYIAWKTALNAFDFLRMKLHNEKIYSKFQDHVFLIAQPHYKGLAPKDKLGHIEQMKNAEISRLLCSLGFKTCVDDARKLYQNKAYKENSNTEEIVLCTVIANNGSSQVWNDIFKIYSEEQDSSRKLMYISALGCSGNQTLVSGFLNKTLEANSGIRKQDLKYVLSSVYNGNMLNIETALKFIINNFEKIATQYGGLDPLGGALVGIAKKLKTKEQLKKLEELVEKIKKNNNPASSVNNAENAIHIAKSNIKWVENKMKQIDTYFNSGSLLSYSFALLLLCLISVFQF